MLNDGFDCPVCGKYKFDNFDDCEPCSECGWAINIMQYDHHDFAEAENTLSVNESKLEYGLLCNIATREAAAALKKEFAETRKARIFEYRKVTRGTGTQSCGDMHKDFVEMRLEYIAKLTKLGESVK